MDDALARCPRCGRSVPVAELDGLCPACLMAAGATSLSQASGESAGLSTFSTSEGAQAESPRLQPGQMFGRYRIDRLIGRGGMGEVYAAEQVENGRRIAIKVLSERLADPQDRARFLREGQLAASVSHPNSVYIFGSEEIDDVPVITMELLPGGTLKDRVKSHGPLPPAEAVDAILQIVAGLDAAQAAGVLHRDVKPGNCFTDADGTVKVGDFGLSISTLARDVTQSAAHGQFRGTPQFASPEQLRGAPIDVCADIYAVGATLYYLLTGQPPFDERDLTALVARVSSESPRSPRSLQPGIPRGLDRVVLRCLAKDTASRPTSYSTLTTALQPFASTGLAPAALSVRFVAGLLDAGFLILAYVGWLSGYLAWQGPGGWISTSGAFWGQQLAAIAYFSALEGLGGASIGKRICGLRVVRQDGQRRVGIRAVARAVVYQLPNIAAALPIMSAPASAGGVASLGLSLVSVLLMAALFGTARRRNGFAALQDLATATRVIRRTPTSRSSVRQIATARPLVSDATTGRCGPFDVVGSLGRTDLGELLVGFDPALRRPVWLHILPVETPALSAEHRDVARPGRLRWLAGARTPTEAWDAYEALDGAPLARRLEQPASWHIVKHWLTDLAGELAASEADGWSSLEPTFNQIWITDASAAKILDFEFEPADRRIVVDHSSRNSTPQAFLSSIADRALVDDALRQDGEVRLLRLPVSAWSLLDGLAGDRFKTMQEVLAACRLVSSGPDRVTRWRRSAHLAFVVVPITGALVLGSIVAPLMEQALDPDFDNLSFLLYVVKLREEGKPQTYLTPEQHDALEVYVAGHYGSTLRDPRTWHSLATQRLSPMRATADLILKRHPEVSTRELGAASATLKDFLANRESAKEADPPVWWDLAASLAGIFLSIIVIPAVLSAIVVKGGLVLNGLGMRVVRRNGAEVSRLRSFARALVAWSPILLLLAIHVAFYASLLTRTSDGQSSALFYWLLEHVPLEWASLIAVVTVGVGAGFAILTPERGLQDRLTGTWVLPK